MTDYIKREDAIEQARRNWTGEGEWIASTDTERGQKNEIMGIARTSMP